MTIRAVCFDLDDTLYDYGDYAAAGLRAAADALADRTGGRYHAELQALYFEAELTDGTFDELVRRHDLPPDVVPELVEAFHSATGPLEPYPDAPGVLERLGATRRLGLVTDGRGGDAKLHRLGLHHHFDAVLVTPTVGRSKRDPGVFEAVLSALSVPPPAAAYVGDDPRVDFRVPNDLGMMTVRLRRGRYVDLEPADEAAAPDREVDSLSALPPLL